jgi:acetyl-CoA carboxylase biotin carboxyl carrier protein
MTDDDKGGPASGAENPHSVWEEAQDLVKRLEGTTVRRLRVEAGEFAIEIERRVGMAAGGSAAALPAAAEGAAPVGTGAPTEQDGRHPIAAPLVGTFYRASEPGGRPFVEEGDVVDAGQTVAIVEAMKLMNHVTADQGGRVVEITASDGDWVEFEQVLMHLEPLGDG